MSYFNEKLAVWEPLLEPVMDTEDNYRPWEILIKVLIFNLVVELDFFICLNFSQLCWKKNYVTTM